MARIILAAAVAISAEALVIPVTDPALFFSPYNWEVSSSSAAASNPGASLKFSFTASTSVALLLSTADLTTARSPCLLLAFSVDDRPWAYYAPPAQNSTLSIPLATDLDAAASHDVRLYLSASCETGGSRWHRRPAAAGGNTFLVITGVAVDAGALLAPPPNLAPGRMLVYGDSIAEGTNAQNYDVAAGRCGGPYGLGVSSSTDSWAFGFAAAMAAELSLAAFAAQGFATRNSLNYGEVPPLLTAGAPAATAWDKVSANCSRLPALAATPPTYVVQALGFNDQNADVPPALLTATVAAWLGAARSALGPAPTLLLILPFGGVLRTANATRGAILQAFADYKASPSGAGDACTLALDLYPASQRGLQGLGAPTAESCDGTHPLAKAHGRLGAMLGAAAVHALAAAPMHCLRSC
jgi:lysophospholipase L1-like esterase